MTYVRFFVIVEIFLGQHKPELVPLVAQQREAAVFLLHQQPALAVAAAKVFARDAPMCLCNCKIMLPSLPV